MARDFYVGNTDHDWFNFCKSQTDLQEVNFWQPSRQHFKALDEGGVFFFRRKAPINKIGGFGILASAGEATIDTSWRDLGLSNGVPTKQDFIDRVKKYRRSEGADGQTIVGFKLLVAPVFLEEKDWIDVPSDWAASIVTGKGYNSDAIQAKGLKKLYERHSKNINFNTDGSELNHGFAEASAGFRYQMNSKIRIGQKLFRMRVLSAYSNRCAITGANVEVCLEAAHISSFAENPNHDVSNGILMRRDIHALFDANLLGIDANCKVYLSERLRKSLDDDSEYLKLHGKPLTLPKSRPHKPCKERLAIHYLNLLP